jgi:hypothetical protein
MANTPNPANPSSVPTSNPALAIKAGVLVFTGTLEAPETDWIQLVRDERDEELIATVIGQTPSR